MNIQDYTFKGKAYRCNFSLIAVKSFCDKKGLSYTQFIAYLQGYIKGDVTFELMEDLAEMLYEGIICESGNTDISVSDIFAEITENGNLNKILLQVINSLPQNSGDNNTKKKIKTQT